jgi:hypothetical protein
VDVLAREAGENRGIVLAGAGWQRQSGDGDNTLTIGDAETMRGRYEESVRFDGVQYASPSVSYAVGWERTDFADTAVHYGSFVTAVTATKALNSRLRAEAHLFADGGTALAGVGAAWTTPSFGQVSLGIAPERGRGVTGYFGYSYSSSRLRISVDDRIWGAQNIDMGMPEMANYRQLQTSLEYRTSPATSLRFAVANQSMGGSAVRTAGLGFVEKLNAGSEFHLDLISTHAGTLRSTGLTTYFSVPTGAGSSVVAQQTLAGSAAASAVTLKQDIPKSGVGTAYSVNFGHGATPYTDATFTSQTVGSTAKLELSRFGASTSWTWEFSGSLLFLGGKAYASHQVVDPDSAADALHGRASANVTLVNEMGAPLPAGAVVRVVGDNAQARISLDGDVQLLNFPAGTQTLIVSLAHANCIAGIVMPPNATASYDLGRHVCARY